MDGYQKYREQSVYSMSPSELLLLLYDEAISRMTKAEYALEEKEYTLFEDCLQRTTRIVRYLIEILDIQQPIGGDLWRIYNYLIYDISRIMAGRERRKDEIGRVRNILSELRGAFDEASRKAELTQKRKAFSGAQKRMEDLDKIIQRLYEDSVLGKLSDLRFQKLLAQYETEQAEIQRLAVSLEREIENEAGQIADVGRFLQLADRYSDLQELDAATVNELIEKIVIHSPEKIGGKKHVTIEVYFTYVGKIRIPLAKPELLTEKPA